MVNYFLLCHFIIHIGTDRDKFLGGKRIINKGVDTDYGRWIKPGRSLKLRQTI